MSVVKSRPIEQILSSPQSRAVGTLLRFNVDGASARQVRACWQDAPHLEGLSNVERKKIIRGELERLVRHGYLASFRDAAIVPPIIGNGPVFRFATGDPEPNYLEIEARHFERLPDTARFQATRFYWATEGTKLLLEPDPPILECREKVPKSCSSFSLNETANELVRKGIQMRGHVELRATCMLNLCEMYQRRLHAFGAKLDTKQIEVRGGNFGRPYLTYRIGKRQFAALYGGSGRSHHLPAIHEWFCVRHADEYSGYELW